MLGGLLLLAVFMAALWGVTAVNAFFLGYSLNEYGLSPLGLPPLTPSHEWLSNWEPSASYLLESARGILLSPLLHGSFSHLLSNTLTLLGLGILVALRGAKTLAGVSLFVIIVGGLLVWLLGRPSVHIGASGLAFGLFGYLVAQGWYERSFPSILIAVVVVILYGGMILGILPQGDFVSWEGHLFGLLAGILAARTTRD